MDSDICSSGSVEERIVAWLMCTAGAVFTGYGTLVYGVVAAMGRDRGAGAMALVLLVMSLLLIGLSFRSLFWRAPSGSVRFGVGYLVVLAAIVAIVIPA